MMIWCTQYIPNKEAGVKGKFIVIEGIDGAGTTTQSMLVSNLLLQKGPRVLTTNEPSDGSIGKLIRQFIKGEANSEHQEKKQICTEDMLALLFAADRLEHVNNVIIPAINNGVSVICDRYYHSSIAYQGSLVNDIQWVMSINNRALIPDVTYILNVDPTVALSRISHRKSHDKYENSAFQARLAEAYRGIQNVLAPQVVVHLDGHLDPQALANTIFLDIIDRFVLPCTPTIN